MTKKSLIKKISSLLTLGLLAPLLALAQWMPSRLGESQLPGSGGNVMVYVLVKNIMIWLLSIFAFIGIAAFIVSGILYLTAAGDESQIEKAKSAMFYSIIGVVVGLSGLVIIYAVDYWLRGSNIF